MQEENAYDEWSISQTVVKLPHHVSRKPSVISDCSEMTWQHIVANSNQNILSILKVNHVCYKVVSGSNSNVQFSPRIIKSIW